LNNDRPFTRPPLFPSPVVLFFNVVSRLVNGGRRHLFSARRSASIESSTLFVIYFFVVNIIFTVWSVFLYPYIFLRYLYYLCAVCHTIIIVPITPITVQRSRWENRLCNYYMYTIFFFESSFYSVCLSEFYARSDLSIMYSI
jgi:hypothetical protein